MERHKYYLEELIKHLDYVDEDKAGVSLIVSEGIYMPPNLIQQNKLNDLILFYYDKSISLLELKGSKGKRQKAIQQLQSGYELVHDVLGYDNIRGKIVYYRSGGSYDFEDINF